MRDYGKVYSKVWESGDFRALTEDGRTLALYLLTCQHGTIAGAFRVPDGYACEDLQWTAERVSEGFRNLESKGFATRCEVTKWVWVRKFLEWNPPENPNQRKAAVKIAHSIPAECGWKPEFMRVCGPSLGIEAPEFDVPPGDGCETLSEGLLNQKQEQKQEQEQKNPSGSEPRKAARKPRGDRFAPESFEVTDAMQVWAVEKAPLVDWRKETEKFRDWEFKHPRTDWEKVWRTWMRKAQEDAVSRAPVGDRTSAGVAL